MFKKSEIINRECSPDLYILLVYIKIILEEILPTFENNSFLPICITFQIHSENTMANIHATFQIKSPYFFYANFLTKLNKICLKCGKLFHQSRLSCGKQDVVISMQMKLFQRFFKLGIIP